MPLVKAVLEALRERGFIQYVDGQVVVTEMGRSWAAAHNIHPVPSFRCSTCQGRGIVFDGLGRAVEDFRRAAARRPTALQEFDQAPITAEYALALVAMMADRGDMVGKDLLVLGDDDLLGVAAALTRLPRRVVVLDVDQRLIDLCQELAQEFKLALEARVHDLVHPLPEDLRRSFDVFRTDPPDTLPGLDLFIGRGLSGLRGPGGAGYFGVTLIEASYYRWRELQERLAQRYRVAVTDIVRDFGLYENWQYLLGSLDATIPPQQHGPTRPWYRSTMFRIEALVDSQLELGPLATEFMGEELYLSRDSLAWRGGH